jgi:hypothetical protein
MLFRALLRRSNAWNEMFIFGLSSSRGLLRKAPVMRKIPQDPTGNDRFLLSAGYGGRRIFRRSSVTELARETFGRYPFLLPGRRGEHSHMGEGGYVFGQPNKQIISLASRAAREDPKAKSGQVHCPCLAPNGTRRSSDPGIKSGLPFD